MPVVDYDATARASQLSVDAALQQCGEFGRGQAYQLSVAGTAWILGALQTLPAVVFTTLQPPAECRKPDDAACSAALASGRLCSLPRDAWQWVPGSPATLVSDFDLVCGRRWLALLQTSAFLVSLLAGCVLWQASSERYGRRRLMYAGMFLSGVAAVLSSTAPSLWAYLAFRCASGLGVGGAGVVAFALATDVAGPSWRSFVGLLLNAFFSVGLCAATLLAWRVPAWRLLTFLAGLACLAFVSTWSLMIESPQYLLLRGRKGEATAALAAIAFSNGRRPPEHPLADPTAVLGNTQRGLRDVLGSSWLRQRLVLLAAAWFAAGAGYWGLALLANGVSAGASIDSSVYGVLLSGFAYEVPGIAAAGLAVERAGRKATGIAAFLQAGACLIVAAVARGTARRALVVAARFGLAAAFATLFMHTAELFPVAVREPALGAANFFGRAGAALTPLFAFLQAQLGSFVPLLVLGCLCIAAAVLSMGLPETLGESCPETVQELNVQMAMRRKRSWRVALASMLRPVPSAAALPRTPSAHLGAAAAAARDV